MQKIKILKILLRIDFYRRFFFFSFMLLWSASSYAQLDNRVIQWQRSLNVADTSQFKLHFDAFGFIKNNEYFNDIVEGYTLLGYQLLPYLSFTPNARVRIDAGLLANKNFGEGRFDMVDPILTFFYKPGKVSFILGTLDGSLNHQLVEPLYEFENALTDRLEEGFQVKLDEPGTFLDVWVDWRKYIRPGSTFQEEIFAGVSLEKELFKREKISVRFPYQITAYHYGGQINRKNAPVETLFNQAVGLNLYFDGLEGFIEGIYLKSYYIVYENPDPAPSRAYKDGDGIYVNLETKTRYFNLMMSYWRADEYISKVGGVIYPSVSTRLDQPFSVQEEREMLIMRILYDKKISKDFSVAVRLEPFYSFRLKKFDFSHGIYLNYSGAFRLLKVKSK